MLRNIFSNPWILFYLKVEKNNFLEGYFIVTLFIPL